MIRLFSLWFMMQLSSLCAQDNYVYVKNYSLDTEKEISEQRLGELVKYHIDKSLDYVEITYEILNTNELQKVMFQYVPNSYCEKKYYSAGLDLEFTLTLTDKLVSFQQIPDLRSYYKGSIIEIYFFK